MSSANSLANWDVFRGISLEQAPARPAAVARQAENTPGEVLSAMRRFVVPIVFAGCGLLAGPTAATAGPETALETPPAVAVQRVAVPSTGIRDEAMMVLVGSVLIGVAAAVRRAV